MKVGDKVICIDPDESENLKKYAVYELKTVSTFLGEHMVSIGGINFDFFKSRFIKDNKLNRKLYRVGKK